MKCHFCGNNDFTIDFIELGQCMVGSLSERSILCINLLSDSSLKLPDRVLLHVAVTCRKCGDRFVKSPDEWLNTAYRRHCQTAKKASPAR